MTEHVSIIHSLSGENLNIKHVCGSESNKTDPTHEFMINLLQKDLTVTIRRSTLR